MNDSRTDASSSCMSSTWVLTYKIDRHTKCSQNGLLCQKAMHVGRRKGVGFRGGYIVPARPWLNLILIDIKGACKLALRIHIATCIIKIWSYLVNEQQATLFQGVLTRCNLCLAAIRPCPIVKQLIMQRLIEDLYPVALFRVSSKISECH